MITIVVEERPAAQMIRDALLGNAPPGIGAVFRNRLFTQNANFEDLQKYSFMTSSRGRAYRREQFKRLVMRTSAYYQKKGIFLREKQIKKYMIEKQLQQILAKQNEMASKRSRERNLERQMFFNENYDKKK